MVLKCRFSYIYIDVDESVMGEDDYQGKDVGIIWGFNRGDVIGYSSPVKIRLLIIDVDVSVKGVHDWSPFLVSKPILQYNCNTIVIC